MSAMSQNYLQFFLSLRSQSEFGKILQEFYSRAEEVQVTKDGKTFYVMAIIDAHPDMYYMELHDYLRLKSSKESQHIMSSIEQEIGSVPLNDQKLAELKSYLSEISQLSFRLKRDFHLQGYSYFSQHLEKIVQNLTDFYFPNADGSMKEQKGQSMQTPIQKLRWTGGVASLATMFFELQTECYDKHPQPFLKASKNEIVHFLANHFVDENGEPFSEATLATYLDPSKPEKKAKRKKAPLDDIFGKRKG
jgi:hypothetical protein